MDSKEIEKNVCAKVRLQFGYANTEDQVNKVYRQARNWVRFHCYLGGACDSEYARGLNHLFKSMRWDRLEELGYETVRTKNGKSKKEN